MPHPFRPHAEFALACALAAWLSPALSRAAEPSCRLGHVADLPVQSRDGKLVTNVRVDDQDLPLIVDTGAADSFVSESTARRLAMRIYRPDERREQLMLRVEGVGGSRNAVQMVADHVSLGNAHGKQLAFLAADGLTFGAGADGMLGMDMLHFYDVDIDLQNHALHLYRPLSDCGSPSVALHGDLYLLKLQNVGWTISPVATVQINGADMTAMIDTGAFRSTLFRPAAKKLGLLGDMALGGKLGGVGADTVDVRLQRNVTIDLGDIELTNVPLLIAEQGKIGQADLLLGYDFFARMHVWISHSSNTLVLQYPPKPSPPVP